MNDTPLSTSIGETVLAASRSTPPIVELAAGRYPVDVVRCRDTRGDGFSPSCMGAAPGRVVLPQRGSLGRRRRRRGVSWRAFRRFRLRDTVGRSRRWVSLPFTDALAPLDEPRRSMAADLAICLEAWRSERGVDRIELRARSFPAPARRPSRPTRTASRWARIPLSSRRRFAASVRRNIRASEKRGLRSSGSSRSASSRTAYWTLHVETRRRLGVMPQPHRFFRLLWQRMLSHDLGFALLALHRGTAGCRIGVSSLGTTR